MLVKVYTSFYVEVYFGILFQVMSFTMEVGKPQFFAIHNSAQLAQIPVGCILIFGAAVTIIL